MTSTTIQLFNTKVLAEEQSINLQDKLNSAHTVPTDTEVSADNFDKIISHYYLDSRTKCNWVERFGKDLVRCFVSKSLSGTIIKKSLDFSKFRITDG